jgi:hypothetical protein
MIDKPIFPDVISCYVKYIRFECIKKQNMILRNIIEPRTASRECTHSVAVSTGLHKPSMCNKTETKCNDNIMKVEIYTNRMLKPQ